MVSALLAPVAAPANTRGVPSQAVAGDADRADKGFASALDLAQAPARAKPGVAPKGSAKADANAKADSKGDSQAEPSAEATTDPNPGTANMQGAQQAGEPDGRTDDPSTLDSDGASDLAQLLSSWPAPPAAAPQGPIAASAPGATAVPSATTAAGAPADDKHAQAVRASLAEPASRASNSESGGAMTRTPLPMQVPVRGTGELAEPGPTLAHQPPPAAAPGERKSLNATALAAVGTEVPAAALGKGGGDTASTAVLPLPALAAPTAHAAASALAPTAPLFEARVAAAVDSSAFAPALASQITWLVREGLQQARFSLNPQEMGPLAVTIVLDGTQARVDFSADMAGTRAAIEASLPTLAAALHDNGLTLAGGGVFDRQSRAGAQGEHGHRAPSQHGGANAPAPAPAGEPDTATPLRAARGLVDLVA